MPPTEQSMDDAPRVRRRVNWVVRGVLVFMALGFALVFFIATRVQPYADDGTPLRMASHRSLGHAGLPVPGDDRPAVPVVRHDDQLRTAWCAGTLRTRSGRTGWARGWPCSALILIPWALVSSLRGRYLFVRGIEAPLALFVGIFTVTMLARWGIVLLWRVFE